MTVAPRVAAIIRTSAAGAAHRVRGAESEDATGASATPAGCVAAVADGHGDPRCPRARRGAELAIAAVLASGSATPMGPDVVEHWRRAVDEDRFRDPEHERLPRLAYGTTVLACRCDGRGVALLQIGDGDVVTVDASGVATRTDRAAPPARGTHSLADEDVLDEMVEHLLPLESAPRIVVLSTDGVDNAYPSDDALLQAAEDMVQRLRDGGPDRLQRDVEEWVARAADASGDDASAVVIVLSEEPVR